MMDAPALRQILGFPMSADQYAATSAPLDPGVIVAAAGSGKTAVMAARVVWAAAEHGVEPERILGLTFTNKAAAELLGRVRLLLDTARSLGHAVGSTDANVSTYNSFAGRLLSDYGIRLGLEPNAQVLTAPSRVQLAVRVIQRAGIGTLCPGTDPSDPIRLSGLGYTLKDLTRYVLLLDDRLSDTAVNVDELQDWDRGVMRRLVGFGSLQVAGRKMLATSRARVAVAELVRRFRAEKLHEQVLDFADQNRLSLELASSPEVGVLLRERFALVLLDEYQDTSLVQRLLMQRLFGDGHPVTAVGDPCQAIYGFRGASVDNIDNFTRHFRCTDGSAARSYSLAENHRSSGLVIAAANRAAEPLRAIHTTVQPLVQGAQARGRGMLTCAMFETVTDEVAWLTGRIEELRPTVDRLSEIAVLVRDGPDADRVHAALLAAGVPVQLEASGGFLHDPSVLDLRCMLELLADPTANVALARLLAGPRWRIGPRDLSALGARAEREVSGGRHRLTSASVGEALHAAVAAIDPADTISLLDVVTGPLPTHDADGKPLPALSDEALVRLSRFADEIRSLRQWADEPVAEIIRTALVISGLGIEIAVGSDAAAQQSQAAVSSFLALAARGSQVDGPLGLTAFLAMIRAAESLDLDLDQVTAPLQPDAVRVMTAHKAKGLEFEYVFVPFASDGSFPSRQSGPRWPDNPGAVPWDLRPDAPSSLLGYPDWGTGPTHKDSQAFARLHRDHEQLEEVRLAYVAMTRAHSRLAVTGHRWGLTQSKPLEPGGLLVAAHQVCEEDDGEIVCWAPMPDEGAANPQSTARARQQVWPAPVDPVAQRWREEAAAAVLAELSAPGLIHVDATLSPADRDRVARWDHDLPLLIAEARAAASQERSVRLPGALSASALINLAEDPDRFALDLVRPMPRPPAPAARRGTAFHAWVESRFGQQPLLLPEDLPGAADDDIGSDDELRRLQEAFERSPFADRTPAAVEAPFAIVLANRVVRGRIDAVFDDGPRVELIDWKTGGRAGLHALQLAIYRVAWAEQHELPLDRVDAAFYLVGSGELVRPTDLPDREALEAIIRA